MGQAPETIVLDDGSEILRDRRAEWTGSRPAGGGWPIECYASGVNANQAQELRDFFKTHGCPTEVTANGDPVYRDANHRKRALKLRGFCDKASYC